MLTLVKKLSGQARRGRGQTDLDLQRAAPYRVPISLGHVRTQCPVIRPRIDRTAASGPTTDPLAGAEIS